MRVVVAALIEENGRLLVGQRRRGDTFQLKWEFPGGKLRPDETPEQGLARELREELGVESVIGPELYRTRHRYSEFSHELLLIFFAARLRAEPACLAFEQVCWVERARLPWFEFLPADQELVVRLAAGDFATS
ncbi:MAG TPA: (deoxy)nucleoside triphosphate pyrophosphohydrolase [Patescibacteria group bacterium]|nr:(deoxy)nucleoside triphosphate pyrophosphohydrolase [Patescibacteria group bacterium]